MQTFIINDKITPDLASLQNSDFLKIVEKSLKENQNVTKSVEEIINAVKLGGDHALIDLCNKFDHAKFSSKSDLMVSENEFKTAEKQLDPAIKKALKNAFSRIKKYHQKQLPKNFNFTDEIGVQLGNIWRAIDSVGIYVPGGTASYPSSVLMSAVPALVAGVKKISICAPTSGGKINPAVLYAAKICNIKTIYKIGGAQAIAALTFGTETVNKVNKIVGPGNSYVATAKKMLFGEVGIDMIAGPTDITIIADESCNPTWIAIDALSQLEHGKDSKAFIICDNKKLAEEITKQINFLKKSLPRLEIIEKSLKNSAIFVIKEIEKAVHLVNFIAPEHLEIVTKKPQKFLNKIQNSGAIFLGNYSPESIGDYIAGPSHTLPTSASAKFSSGLSVFDFLKRISLISCTKKSFQKLASDTSILAGCEGLQAHKLSIDIRND